MKNKQKLEKELIRFLKILAGAHKFREWELKIYKNDIRNILDKYY